VRLPATAPAGIRSMLDFFLFRFPRIPEATWRQRFDDGRVWTAEGPVGTEAPFQPLIDVHYRREVEHEPPVRTDVTVVWSDDDLLVVDKPPFLPVTPGGRWVRGCLLHLLGDDQLVPLHRIDRLTSGLVVLSRRAMTRAQVSLLFQLGGPIAKVYTAVCEVRCPQPPANAVLEHHLERSPSEYWRQIVVPGQVVNASSEIELLDRVGDLALLAVRPRTGRKHQIRVQLAAIGLPILDDPLYGTDPRHQPDDLSRRMWLDAHQLTVSGLAMPSGSPLTATWRSSRVPEEMLRRAAAGR